MSTADIRRTIKARLNGSFEDTNSFADKVSEALETLNQQATTRRATRRARPDVFETVTVSIPETDVSLAFGCPAIIEGEFTARVRFEWRSREPENYIREAGYVAEQVDQTDLGDDVEVRLDWAWSGQPTGEPVARELLESMLRQPVGDIPMFVYRKPGWMVPGVTRRMLLLYLLHDAIDAAAVAEASKRFE